LPDQLRPGGTPSRVAPKFTSLDFPALAKLSAQLSEITRGDRALS